MVKYDIRYTKHTTGHLWWKKYEWAWGLYEITEEDDAEYPWDLIPSVKTKEVLIFTAPTAYEIRVKLDKIKYDTEWRKHYEEGE